MKATLFAGWSLCFILSNTACLPAQGAAPAAPVVKAQNTQGTPDERADQLIAEMTFAEKVSLIGGDRSGFNTHAIPRLGIPEFTMSDGPQGVRNAPGPNASRYACAFPCGAALAATWDAGLATAYGKAVGLEDRARGTHFQLGPGLNICRVPVNGRNFEYFGEDPYLASIIAVNWVKACSVQGSVPTIKHFDANNQEWNRNSVDVQADERVLHEIYLPAFKKAATEGGVVAVMCSYNRLNGFYASANDWLLNEVLKKQWGFKGLVMSDWGASHATTDVARGLDLEMPNPANFSFPKIQNAMSDGSVKESDIDHAVHRILRTAAAQGWLDAGWEQKNAALPLDSPDSDKVALAVAENAIVLLKNDRHALPLDRARVKTIVVAGPNASAPEGRAPANMGGGGSGAVETFPSHYASANYLDGITKSAGSNIKVIYLPEPPPIGESAFALLTNAWTSVKGQPGLTLTVNVTGDGPAVQIPPTVQTAINTNWPAGQLPFGVPANRDATFTWTGVLKAPNDSDWQIVASGNPVIIIDGRTNASGDIVHLQSGKPLPVVIQASAQANAFAGRGRRGGFRGGFGGGFGGGRQIRLALVPPQIPDLAAAKTADAVVLCVGFNRNTESEGRDRPFDLPPLQQYLINSAGKLNRHTIVINNSGAGVEMSSWEPGAAAILQAWYLGQEGGTAIGEVLFGDVNPSGHLISTFDRKFEDNPAYPYYPGKVESGANYPVEPYTEGIFYGYRGYDKDGKKPLFPFGYGLSYTSFKLSDMKVEKSGGEVSVSLDLKNTGGLAGAEVVQIYVGETGCPVPRPLRELKGFSKLALAPGESKHLEITLPRDAFAYWSSAVKDWTVDAGHRFTIEAGFSERDIRARQAITY
ncbi:MAG TPA: glycoside hydrolase family 3 C-terminal domain-containing protein [Verrucomicrobiae bacterium]|nr:glycoside hydrolase family 3 C-terminal domain-containing protein [Verrucomicrobiae bacterium]